MATRASDRTRLSDAMQRLGDELGAMENVVAAIESSRPSAEAGERADDPAFPESASDLERSLMAIWKKVLGRSAIGFEDNFFDVSGTSLKAVMVIAMIRSELKKDASIISLFECPTVRLLAAKLDPAANSGCENGPTESAAESRGRQRRSKLIKRKVA
jgi:hypothetical protein